MGPGDPATRPSRETWIGCFIRLLASHGDQCDPSLYLFLRWLAVLLFRSILSQMMPSATDGNASFLRAARAGNLEKVLDYLKGSIDINTSNANGLNALHLAAKEGHVNVVSELLKRGANVNATTKKGNSALHIASLAGQEEVVKLLVQKQANVNVQSQNGFTPLYMAAQENHDGVVRFLLANGANQSLATEDGFTPLAVALQQGHDKVVAVLLENDARGKVRLPALHIASKKDDCKAAALLLHSEHNPDVTSKSGFTPLHIAAHYGNSNIASLLLEKGADVNFPAKHQITPLHVAAKWGKSNMVKLLLEKGAKIDASTRDGLTPLHCAARSGHDQVVEQLLEKNAPITAKTKNGLAPLHMASQGDHVDSARILLYHKAPVDDVTVDYLTALHVAAHCGHVGVAKLLLDRRADPNARALNGFTPLHIACKKNRIKVVELLLKHGASIEATTESGLTPLHVASFMGCMNIVIYLIQHGANPDIPTVRGETPLHLAARANQTDIIRILLRNGAHVDAKARELQTALHIASRLGNADMVGLLLQHGAAVDAPTKDAYTPLHVAAREGQDEVAALLLDHGAALAAPTKKGFTPLHLAAKYGNLKVAQLLLQKDAPVDAQGKNGVTPLHVAAHYDHVNVALLLLEKGASPHSAARNGYTPLHVAARKDQMDIASSLLEYGAKPGAESRAGFTPLHLAAQEGHADLAALLVEHGADCDAKAKNGLTPMHLCAQEDRVEVATILAKHGASLDPTTKAGYTPLHVACHFGQTNMIRFLLRQGANVNATTSHGYTPLHQAAQQGHTLIINLLLEHRAAPNAITNQGQTALAIAQRLGYISVVETLKVVTETIVTTTTTTVTEEKYRVVAPETMHETFMSDSEDEAAEDNMLGDQSFRYLTADEMKSLGDDSLPIDVTRDERITESIHITREPGHSAPLTQEEERLSPTQAHTTEAVFVGNYAPDNVDLSRTPIHAGSLLSWDGDSCSSAYVLSPTKRMWRESSKLKWKTFLVSFMVDARGGAMRGCRHSGVRVIIPPRKAQMPMRITCRYLRKEKLPHPPPLLEGEACASRILEVGPAGAKFLGPVILEVPHFASLRGKEREISILRSDNGETWKEHTLEASEEAVQEVLNESFEGEELSALEDLQTNRIVRILTTDFPQYFAVVSRTRQEVHAVGPEGGLLSSTVVPQVQAIFPEGALTKKIRVGLQAQPIPAELVTKLLGHRVAVSPIVTVEPRRRKFHKPITLTIPVPQAATKGMINQYAGDAPTLRLLCSITGGTNKAQWEDVTGSTPLTFVNDCVSFTTTVSARFWLMDCRQVSEATKFATELYAEAMHVPFMAKFVVFAKRLDPMEAQLRVFCMTDDKEDKTLESQEHFTEVAKSRDVEVLEKKSQYLEFGGNLVPVTKSGEQLQLQFQAFRENRLPFSVRVKDPHQEPLGRLAFMRQPRAARATEPPQAPLCNLNIALPEYEATQNLSELVTLEKKYGFVEETGLAKPELIHRADLRLSDIARELGSDWPALAAQLDVPEQDVASIRTECPSDLAQQALLMLRLWMKRAGGRATGNNLEKGLRMINREDIVNKCMFNVELVTDDVEKAVAKVHLDQSGFDTFREELGTPKDTSLKRDASLDVSYDEQDLMKAESAEETSSETGSVHEKHTGSEAKVGEHVPDGATQGADIALPGMELPTVERRETKETPGGVVEVIEVTTHEVSKPSSPGLLSKVSKIPKKIFPRGSKSKSSDEESPSTPKRELKETPGGVVEVIEVTKHDVAKAPESKHMDQDGTKVLWPTSPESVASSIEGLPPTHMTREIKEVPGGVVEVVRVTKHVVGKLPEDKHSGELSTRTVDPSIPWEAELAKDPAAVVKREVKETPEGHVEVVQVIRREAGDAPFVSDFPGDGSDGTVSRRIETTVVDGKPTIIRRLVTTTSDGIQQVTEHIEQGAEEVGSTASSLFAKMGEFARGLSSDDSSAVTTREVKKLPDGSVEVVSITKRSSSSPGKETAATERLPSSTSGSMHFAESAAGKPTEAKTAILRREVSGPETIVCTTSVVTSATTSGSSKPELSADVLDKMFGDIGKPKVDDRLKDVLTAEGGYGAKREVTPEEAELLAQLFPEQSSGVAPYPPAGLVPEAAIIPEYRSMMATEGPPLSPHDPESKEKVLLKLGRALSQDDLDAPSPTRGEAAMTVTGLGEAVDASDQVEEPVVEKLELARRESKRYSQEFEQDEPLPKAMGLKTKPSEETVVSSTQVKGIHDNGTVKHTVTTVTKTTIIQEVEEPAGAPRPGESETWASDLDTSQVSVSSLPEDERTEPTLSSSATTATADAEALSGPLARTQVEEKASKKQKKRGKKRSKN
uniref:Ankyrin n=1 Tax=Rhipicephalus zambeziensis TaxID=60191 RepID=A0A224YHI9_9ACAR